MAIRRHGSGFQVDVSYRGQRAPRVTVSTREEAERLAAQYKADLVNGRVPSTSSARASASKTSVATLGALLDYAARNHWRGMKAYETQVRCAEQCVRWFGHSFPVKDVTSSDIAKMAEEWSIKGNAPGTINRKIIAFRVTLKIAHKLGEIDKVPEFILRKEYEGRLRWFSQEEEADLLEWFRDDPAMRDALVLGLDLGFRQGEIFALQARDWNPENRLVTTWETKGNKARSNPATDRASAVISRLAHGKAPTELLLPGISRKEISRRMQRWKAHKGLPQADEACFHTTRHTCCTRLVMAGVPLPTVQTFMGHKDIQTTMRYAHLSPNALDSARDVLNAVTRDNGSDIMRVA